MTTKMVDDGAPTMLNMVDAGNVVHFECDIPKVSFVVEDVPFDEIDEALLESIRMLRVQHI